MKPSKPPKQEQAIRQGRAVGVPEAQLRPGLWATRDVANRTDADQRDMMSLKRTKTVRRLTHLEKLHRKQIITRAQLALCEWYSDQRELGYSTLGITANYCGAGGGGFGSRDLLARYKAQNEARNNFGAARSAIDVMLLPLFVRIVIGHHVPKDAELLLFDRACLQMEEAVGHLVSFE